MPPRYIVNVRGQDGTLKAMFDSWSDKNGGLTYTKKLDDVGEYSFAISMDDSRRQYFVKDAFIEIRRSVPDHNITWYTDFVGLHRDVEKQVDAAGNRLFVSKGPDLNHLLKRSRILFFSDDPLAGQNTFADDAMKNFVDQNCGPGALAPPRIKDHVFPNLSIDTLTGAAPIWSGSRPFNNLFDVLHEIALAALVDFQITLDSWAPLAMTFRTYFPYLGKDRSQGGAAAAGNTPAVFSLALNNMAEPHYTSNSRDEITTVIALGQGSQSDREYAIVQSDGTISNLNSLNDSPWNDIEETIDQRQDGLVQSLQDSALSELQLRPTKTDVTYKVLNSSKLVYGRDYNFGDNVTVTFDDIDGPFDKRVTAVTVSVVALQESTTPTFSEVS